MRSSRAWSSRCRWTFPKRSDGRFYTLRNPPKAPVDRVIRPGEELPFCGGLVVIGTPGHTPGHISLYHRPSRTLIAADALRVVD